MADAHLIIDPKPEGWQDLQFDDLCERVQESVQPVPGGSTLYVGLEHLAPGFPALLGHGVEGDVTSSKAGFREGDILFGKLRPYLRKGAQADFDGMCSTDILVFRVKESGSEIYVRYLVHSDQFIAHANATTSGVQHPRTSWSSLREFKVTVPPLPDRQHIAQVLSTVQEAIVQQERLIRTTTELKQALMQKLFTEGMRGEKLKETEIGLVPERWSLLPVGKLFHTQLGKMLSPKARTGSSPKPYLRNKNVQWDGIDTTDLHLMDFDAREASKFRLRTGDLLICEGGEVGRTAIWTGEIEECYYQKALHMLRPKDGRILPAFMAYWMRFAFQMHNIYGVTGTRTTIAHLPEVKLTPLLIPLPSIEEQTSIVQALEQTDKKLGQVDKKLKALQCLFRTLLHELMTGKVRVGEMI